MGPPQSLIINGLKTSSPRQMAIEIQKYLTNKIQKLLAQLPVHRDNPFKILDRALMKWKPDKFPEYKLREISRDDVISLIKRLGKSMAFGHDFIDAQSVKTAAKELANPIKHLVNLSIKQRKFPHRWKITRVVPLYKSKDWTDRVRPRTGTSALSPPSPRLQRRPSRRRSSPTWRAQPHQPQSSCVPPRT